jgi:exodeoxyribonuclease VII large subunit
MRFHEERTLSVAALNRAVRLGLEHEWSDVLVVGEIRDLTRAASGHVYFSLNDENESAQLRVVMFRSDVSRSRAKLETGARVSVRGGLTLYEARGTFQMLARAAFPAGEGDLAAQFRRLLEKLSAEGLTDPARKRPLPQLPRCIGLVTSEQGAALHDVIRVAQERCPVRIVLSPCSVQGDGAPRSIVVALASVQRVPELDVVIVARGGGSAEDLWAFNDESVARAIAACRVPVVSGVGHEIDTSIADLVADVRAATPSNAAELVVPQRRDLQERLGGKLRALIRALETRLGRERLVLTRAARRIRDPRPRLARGQAQLHACERRLSRAFQAGLARLRLDLDARERRLGLLSPSARLSAQRLALVRLSERLAASPRRWLSPRKVALDALEGQARGAARTRLDALHERLAYQAIRVDAMSPLRVLSRGYAIAFVEGTGKALLRAADVTKGDRLRLRLHEGDVRADVVE